MVIGDHGAHTARAPKRAVLVIELGGGYVTIQPRSLEVNIALVRQQ